MVPATNLSLRRGVCCCDKLCQGEALATYQGLPLVNGWTRSVLLWVLYDQCTYAHLPSYLRYTRSGSRGCHRYFALLALLVV